MTVYRMGEIHRYIGSSTDDKPTSTQGDLPYGSEFYETDTSLTRIYGSTGWSVLRMGTKST